MPFQQRLQTETDDLVIIHQQDSLFRHGVYFTQSYPQRV
jgi:hypothetical protein